MIQRHPAPTRQVTLFFKGGSTEQALVNVLDLQGKLLQQHVMPDGSGPKETTFNLDGLPAGAYLIQLIAEGKVGVQKLVVWQIGTRGVHL